MIESKFTVIRNFIREIYAIIRYKFYMLIVFGVLNSFLQVIGVVIIIPLLETYNSGKTDTLVAKSLIFFGWNGTIEWILAFYFIVLFLYGLFRSLYVYQSAHFVSLFIHSFSIQSFEKIIFSPWKFYTKNAPSDLNVLFQTEMGHIKSLTLLTFRIIQTVLIIVIQLIMSIWLSWQITFFTFIAIALIYFVQKKIISKNYNVGNKRVQITSLLQKFISETFFATKLIKLHQLEESRSKTFEDLQGDIYKNDLKTAKLDGLSDFFFITTGAVVIVGIIYASINFNLLKIGGLLILLVLLFKVIAHVQSLVKAAGQYMNLLPSYQQINEITASTNDYIPYKKNTNRTAFNINSLTLKKITFAYKNRNILENRDFNFKKGNIYLFFGPSGKGKTTTLDLISGLIQAQQGEIYINENLAEPSDLKNIQQNISYVLQETILFQGTILENICFGNSYSSEEIDKAIELAGLSHTLTQHPDGIHTIIDENATILSGGEKQRISIARALISNSSILLLDEITSSLDARNEAHIMETIASIKQDKIILIVGHREKLKDWADVVVEF